MSISGSRSAGRSHARARKPAKPTIAQPKTAQRKPSPPTAARRRELATKRRGELSELAFVYKAAREGFAVAKPYGDSERYDCILDNGHRFWRIQVKSTTTLLDGLYHVNAGRHTNGQVLPYQSNEIDFLAAHVVPEDTWFLIPVSILDDRISILLAPSRHPKGPGLYAAYREAWHLLRAKKI